MAKTYHHPVRLTPPQVVARLRSATVPYEVVADRLAPVRSYARFLTESVAGPKELVARIDGRRFRLTPIGVRPFKGPSWTAPVGALDGEVRPAEGGGSVL